MKTIGTLSIGLALTSAIGTYLISATAFASTSKQPTPSSNSQVITGTWEPLIQIPSNSKCIAYGPDGSLYEGASNGLFKKTGDTWSLIPGSDKISSICSITWAPQGALTVATDNDYVQQYVNGKWSKLGTFETKLIDINSMGFAFLPETFKWYSDGTLLLVSGGSVWEYSNGVWRQVGNNSNTDMITADRLSDGSIVGINQLFNLPNILVKYENGSWVEIPGPSTTISPSNLTVTSDGKLKILENSELWQQESDGSWMKSQNSILQSISWQNYVLWEGWDSSGTLWAATYVIPTSGSSEAPTTMSIWSYVNGEWVKQGSQSGTETEFGAYKFFPFSNGNLVLDQLNGVLNQVNSFTLFDNGAFNKLQGNTLFTNIRGSSIAPDGNLSVSTENGIYEYKASSSSWLKTNSLADLSKYVWSQNGSLIGVSSSSQVVEYQNGQPFKIGNLQGVESVTYSPSGILTARTPFDVYQLVNGAWKKVDKKSNTAGLCVSFAPNGAITVDDGKYIDEYKNRNWIHIAKYPAVGIVTAMKWIGNDLLIGIDNDNGIWKFSNGKWTEIGLKSNYITGILQSQNGSIYATSDSQVWMLQR